MPEKIMQNLRFKNLANRLQLDEKADFVTQYNSLKKLMFLI